MPPNVLPWLWPVCFYLIGSIPTGYLMGKSRGIDIRQHGSGNIGATNVGRVMGRNWGLFAFGCDFLKGLLPLFLVKIYGVTESGSWDTALLLVACGLAAILGHNYTPWLGFKGGKGIATSGGVLCALMPPVFAVAFSLWIIAVLLTRTVSIGSLLAAAVLPLAAAWFYPGQWVYFGLAASLQYSTVACRDRIAHPIFIQKKRSSMNIIILGHGAWGRAIGGVAERLGNRVTFVSHTDSAWPSVQPDYLLLALPVQHVRETLSRFAAPGVPVLSLGKGLEISTGHRVSQIIKEVWGEQRVGALSGPTFASEIALGLPAICTVAAQSEDLTKEFQSVLHQPSFRTYSSSDLIGVELGGALKNIYAIAGGACHGLKLGQNSLAGLLTRCLAEMTRIGVQSGARAETFAGLSGLGDLMLTATSEMSRNFRFGTLLAQGLSVEEILPKLDGVCEGLPTTRSVYLNSAIPADSKPIVTQLHAVLYEGMSPVEAVKNLLGRAARDE